jgi:hypothetical protein
MNYKQIAELEKLGATIQTFHRRGKIDYRRVYIGYENIETIYSKDKDDKLFAKVSAKIIAYNLNPQLYRLQKMDFTVTDLGTEYVVEKSVTIDGTKLQRTFNVTTQTLDADSISDEFRTFQNNLVGEFYSEKTQNMIALLERDFSYFCYFYAYRNSDKYQFMSYQIKCRTKNGGVYYLNVCDLVNNYMSSVETGLITPHQKHLEKMNSYDKGYMSSSFRVSDKPNTSKLYDIIPHENVTYRIGTLSELEQFYWYNGTKQQKINVKVYGKENRVMLSFVPNGKENSYTVYAIIGTIRVTFANVYNA